MAWSWLTSRVASRWCLRDRGSVRRRCEEKECKWWRTRVIVGVLVRVMFFKPSGSRLDACVGTRHDGLGGVGGW